MITLSNPGHPVAKSLLYGLFFLLSTTYNVSGQENAEVVYVRASTKKIAQIVGDHDNETDQPTENQTLTRYNLWGTDLGIPFQHKNKIYVLFGDVPGSDRDPIAYTEDDDPEDGLDLTFISAPDGDFRPITIPGISQGAFEVPVEGVSVNDVMYVYFSTGHFQQLVLAKSADDGVTFELVGEISRGSFINVSIEQVETDAWPGLPAGEGMGMIIFGSGTYRQSNVKLAFQPVDQIEHKEAIRYFTGLNETRIPQWSADENDAIPLFDQPCVGEFSVTHNSLIDRWIMLYNCDAPRGINFRTATDPWGPWSEPQVLFDPWEDNGYCHFMHVDWNFDECDEVNDPNRLYEWGGEYGPYQFGSLATGNQQKTTIYFTMSTWNPYTVVLMKSTLEKINATAISDYYAFSLSTYPNPSDGLTRFEWSSELNGDLSFKLYDATGRLVYYTPRLESKSLTLDVQGHPPGIYFYRFLDEKGRSLSTGRLVVR